MATDGRSTCDSLPGQTVPGPRVEDVTSTGSAPCAVCRPMHVLPSLSDLRHAVGHGGPEYGPGRRATNVAEDEEEDVGKQEFHQLGPAASPSTSATAAERFSFGVASWRTRAVVSARRAPARPA